MKNLKAGEAAGLMILGAMAAIAATPIALVLRRFKLVRR